MTCRELGFSKYGECISMHAITVIVIIVHKRSKRYG